MESFKDTRGKRWMLHITFGALQRVRAYTGLDLLADPGAIYELLGDIVKTVDAIYAICKPEADRYAIDDTAFGELFDGEALLLAREAMAKEIVNFTPPDRREALSAGIQKILETEKRMLRKALDRVGDPIWEAEVDREIERILAAVTSGPSFTGSQEQSGSTLAT